MSFSMTILPIIAALLAPEGKFMNRKMQWNAVNKQQEFFLNKYFSKKDELTNFTEKEIRAWASQDHNELNKLARDNGFDIQLQPFKPYEFGSLAIFDVMVKWLQKGISTRLTYQDKSYKAVKLEDSNFNVYKFAKGIHDQPIVEIKTQSKDKVYMTIADKELKDFELLDKISSLRDQIANKNYRLKSYTDVIFPCIDLNHEVDISWLIAMYSNGNKITISQALQQTKLKMDETGARVESAVMLGMCRSCYRLEKQLIIDKPFYIWIERENCSIPVFAGYIEPSDWVKSV
ncbi:MAG: serpin family protein [Candidatus Babeliales bacterium]|nr:serpin family protein [Candidatus Babeliales bacterium]